MQEPDPVESMVDELKRSINVLEWDIPHLKDEKIKRFKVAKLEEYKKQLVKLTG